MEGVFRKWNKAKKSSPTKSKWIRTDQGGEHSVPPVDGCEKEGPLMRKIYLGFNNVLVSGLLHKLWGEEERDKEQSQD